MSGPVKTSAVFIDPVDLSYELPDGRIAQEPLAKRDDARLMVLRRASTTIGHSQFKDLPALLRPGDTLVLNEAKVSRVKLEGRKSTGGKVEAILIGPADQPSRWFFLLRPAIKPGTVLHFPGGARAVVKERSETGEYRVEWSGEAPDKVAARIGRLPLPPYIKRSAGDSRNQSDALDYQTVYSRTEGSLAAPTAGLHFTPSLLKNLERAGVHVEKILLHVGWGTFKPVQTSIETHRMPAERVEISDETFQNLKKAKKEKHRIIGVGTTVTRALESLPVLSGATDLFIRPGFEFRWLDGLITNFHVPRSTPIALTAAFAGRNFLEKAYGTAIEENYRFYSYGDAMLIL